MKIVESAKMPSSSSSCFSFFYSVRSAADNGSVSVSINNVMSRRIGKMRKAWDKLKEASVRGGRECPYSGMKAENKAEKET